MKICWKLYQHSSTSKFENTASKCSILTPAETLIELQRLVFVCVHLCSHLPKIYQAFLMSATLNDDVQALKELVLHNPVSAAASAPAAGVFDWI